VFGHPWNIATSAERGVHVVSQVIQPPTKPKDTSRLNINIPYANPDYEIYDVPLGCVLITHTNTDTIGGQTQTFAEELLLPVIDDTDDEDYWEPVVATKNNTEKHPCPKFNNPHGWTFHYLFVLHGLSDECVDDFAHFMSHPNFDPGEVPPNHYYLKKLDKVCIDTTPTWVVQLSTGHELITKKTDRLRA
jgi:hypothetical protein